MLLVLDAGTGQNAISQAKQFNQTVNLTGLALTKLDGTAKGGVIFALAKQFGMPIRYIGVGEGIDDLRTFEAESFVQALFAGAQRAGAPMIRFEQVGKRYANGHVGLHELSFRVRRGEFLFVTGHSGAGKSTLLRLLLAMERPTSGKLLLAGQDLGQISNAQIPFLRRQIGVVFQNHQLLFDRSVFNNVALPLQILGLSKPEIVKRVGAALERVSLSDKIDLFPGDLSTGQQQRVGIARAVVHRPALLLADEPTGNLDPRLAAEIMGVFEDINRLGTSVLIASHDLA